MKSIANCCNKYNKFTGIFIIFVFLILLSGNVYSSVSYTKWGISRGKVVKLLLPNEETYEFTPADKPKYENKIMNMVNLILKNIDSDVYEKIKIISTKKNNPRKDFLLFKNKLFSIKEYYKLLSKKDLRALINALSKKYGPSNHNPGSDMEIYFISSKNTKVIVHYFLKTKVCEVYYYDSHLYHKLSSNEF